jgi:hypothetical protein
MLVALVSLRLLAVAVPVTGTQPPKNEAAGTNDCQTLNGAAIFSYLNFQITGPLCVAGQFGR